MKKIYSSLSLLLLCLFCLPSQMKAQAPPVPHLIYGSSPYQDSLWAIDTTNWTVVRRLSPTLPSFTITGITGMAYDPTTYETYVIMKVSAVSGRVLGKIDLQTGICTQVGNLGDNFSSITFLENGQLLGATGNGATVPETMYTIDKNTAAKTVLYTMGNGADGEIILYNRADDFIYHWSGGATLVFEKMAASAVSYTPTNIPTTGTSGGETFGALYVKPNYFILSNISGNFRGLNPQTGQFAANSLIILPDDLRGIIMPPAFTISNDTLCEEIDTVFIGMGNLQLFDSITYHWGDATTTALQASATGASHSYAAPGNYTIHIVADNGIVTDTISSFTIHVNNIPNVTLTGSSALCPNDTISLTGSSGGTSQWYLNGSPIVGANTNTINVSGPGIYNMVKTNLNGCGDSAAVGINLVTVSNPVVTLGPDITACGNSTLFVTNIGATYAWSTGGTQQSELISSTGTYNVVVTDSNNCSASDTINVTILSLPAVNIGPDTAACNSYTLTETISGNYLWSDNSTGSSLTVFTSGIYTLIVTDSNGCNAIDSVNITINTPPFVGVAVAVNSICVDDADVQLVGTPPGGTFGGNSVTGSFFDPSIGAGQHDVYYTFTDANGCSDSDTLTLTVSACVGVVETEEMIFSIYPNPTSGNFTLQLNTNNAQIEIMDLLGRTVYSSREINSGNLNISLSEQPAGLYLVRVITAGKTSVQRIEITN